MEWFLNRLKEPSTWAGFIGLLASAGIAMSAELQTALVALGVGVVSFALVLIKELKGKK